MRVIITAFDDKGFHRIIGEFDPIQIHMSIGQGEDAVTRQSNIEEMLAQRKFTLGMTVEPSKMPEMTKFTIHVEE